MDQTFRVKSLTPKTTEMLLHMGQMALVRSMPLARIIMHEQDVSRWFEFRLMVTETDRMLFPALEEISEISIITIKEPAGR